MSGSEFAGVVVAVPSSPPGGKQPAYKKGDKVFGANQGGYATMICAPEERIRKCPDGWSSFEAAGLFVTAPTSYAALVTRAGIKKGMFKRCDCISAYLQS